MIQLLLRTGKARNFRELERGEECQVLIGLEKRRWSGWANFAVGMSGGMVNVIIHPCYSPMFLEIRESGL